MKTLRQFLKLRLLTAVAAVFAFAYLSPVASAQNPVPPYALFQYATLTGSGNTISATQIPVVTATGAVKYLNMTLQFNVDSSGNLTVATGSPQFVPAPTLIVSSFKAGSYQQSGTNSGYYVATVAGPGVTSGGATEWTLANAGGYTHPYTATWYVGPTGSSPIAARLQKAGITSTAYSYGVAGGQGIGYTWSTNALIGVSQVGNTLTFVSFTDSSGVDHNQPVDQITFTLVQ